MFGIMMYIIPVIAIGIIIFTIAFMFSSKLRGKMMSKQVKATKYMIDETKEDIKDISTDMANATKEEIEITSHALKTGLTASESIYCKYCGEKIDKDSKFCKSCGKEQ